MNAATQRFQEMQISAAVVQISHLIEGRATHDLMRNVVNTRHKGRWTTEQDCTKLLAFGILGCGKPGTGYIGAAQAWVDQVKARRHPAPSELDQLRHFHEVLSRQPLDVASRSLKAHIENGGGLWLLPERGLHSPPSHLIEIQFLGVSAIGTNVIEVTRNWLKQADSILNHDAAA